MSAAKESADGKAAEDVAPTGFYRVVSTTSSKLASDFLAKVCVWAWLFTSRLVDDIVAAAVVRTGAHSSLVWWQTYDGDAELVFPSYLQVRHKVEPLQLVGKKVTWYRPTTVDQLVAIRRRHPDVRERVGSVVCVCVDRRRAEAPVLMLRGCVCRVVLQSKIIGGATEISIETRFKGSKYPVRVHIGFVEALRAINVHEPGAADAPDARGGLSIGGAVTLAETRCVPSGLGAACCCVTATVTHGCITWWGSVPSVACKKLIAQRPKEARTLSAIEDMVRDRGARGVLSPPPACSDSAVVSLLCFGS